MILTADYHTHTKYSHGKSSVLENAIWAKDHGLKQIAVTDHGFSHPAFGLTKSAGAFRFTNHSKKKITSCPIL